VLSPGDLDALQPASFTLTTLSFTTLGVGISPLTFSQAQVLDAFAAPLSLTMGSGSTAAVPEPGTLALLGSGLNRTTGDWHRGALADTSRVVRPFE
jgi:hypothetical protein